MVEAINTDTDKMVALVFELNEGDGKAIAELGYEYNLELDRPFRIRCIGSHPQQTITRFELRGRPQDPVTTYDAPKGVAMRVVTSERIKNFQLFGWPL